MGISKRITTFLFIISLLNLIPYPSHAAVVPNNAARIKIRGPKLSASDANSKNPNRVDPKRDCGEMGSRSECTQNTTCRWCRSNALDDMCFSKSEASRLPPQKRLELKQKIETKNGDVRGNHDDNEEEDHMDEF